jgi:hypothetical protein
LYRGRSVLAGATALALLLAACGGSGKKKAATATTTTTTMPSTTTTTIRTTAPLTGLPQPDVARRDRVALVVKIDNVPAARPQAGLASADVVYEEMVESGLTRLAAVFQSADADPVGPVRSTRSSDVDIVSALNHPLFAYSGGQPRFVALLHDAGVVDVGANAQGGAFYRGRGVAPDNLYTRTSALFAVAPPGAGPPPPLFSFRPAGQPVAGAGAAGAAPAVHADVHFPASSATWDWDAASQTWKRGQNGTADVVQGGQQISAANVIIQVLPYSTDGYASGEGIVPPPPIPKAESVGEGTAIVLTGGMVINVHWSKASPTAVTAYTDSAGQPVLLTPGQTWIELVPTGSPVTTR